MDARRGLGRRIRPKVYPAMIKGPRSYAKEWIVRGEIWSLKFKSRIDGWDSLGECSPEDKTISLKTGQSKSELLKSLLHELVHCAEFEYNFTLDHKHVYKLEEALYDLLLQNWASLKAIIG